MKPVVRSLMLGCIVAALANCTTERWTQDQPPQDITTARQGATRAQLEASLGAPRREWTTAMGVHYAVYAYDIGAKGDKASHLLSLITVLSFGLPELLLQGSDDDPRGHPGDAKRTRFLAVSYDAKGEVIGVFRDVGEFTQFPEDGVPTKP